MDSNETTLLQKLEEKLKHMHVSRMPVRTVAKKAIEAVCAPEKKDFYEILLDDAEKSYFKDQKPSATNALLGSIFNDIDLPWQFNYVDDPAGAYITVKVRA